MAIDVRHEKPTNNRKIFFENQATCVIAKTLNKRLFFSLKLNDLMLEVVAMLI
jgi:hypothetical protein